jgi:LmbE family N-acetylglucosaminyl deacetylase
MKLFDPDPKLRWLFCMTHPDDEISICAWIRRLSKAGNEVFLCWTHSTAEREAEAREVAKLLLVPAERLTFMDAPDGDACDHIVRLLPEYVRLMREVGPDRVVCGAFEHGHLDHEATNFLVSRTFAGPILEVPFYHTYTTKLQRMNRFADPETEEVLHLELEEQALKKRVARMYPSQNIWSVLLWYEIWQASRLKRVELAKSERMRLHACTDFTVPNLPLKLATKVAATPAWQRWVSAVKAADAELP